MVALWKSMCKPETVRIIAPDGSVRSVVVGYHTGDIFFIDDMSADLEQGDELRRVLPNGKDDVYQIVDPQFIDNQIEAPHYQVKVQRKGMFAHDAGGYRVSVSGDNARVNIQSTDNSVNVVNSGSMFSEMRDAITKGVTDREQVAAILAAIDRVEQDKGTSGFLGAYQHLVGVAADHIGLLAPFLPALSQMIA